MNRIWKMGCLVAVLVVAGSGVFGSVVEAKTTWQFEPPYDGKTLEISGGSSSGVAGYGNSSYSSYLQGKMYFWVSSWAGPGLGEASSFAQSGIYKRWECPRTSEYRITFTISYDGIYGYAVSSPVPLGYGKYQADFGIGCNIYDVSERRVLNYKYESISPFPLDISSTLDMSDTEISGKKDFIFIETLEKGHEYRFSSYTEPETYSTAGGIATAGGKIDFTENGIKLEKIVIEDLNPTCAGTDTSCGIYPNCENCNAKDGCYAYSNGCEIRDYYCKSNEEGCKYKYSGRHTDYYDDWVNYCKGDEVWKHRLFHDFYCDGGKCKDHTSWRGDQLVENCNDKDGWYNKGNSYSCCDGDKNVHVRIRNTEIIIALKHLARIR